MKAEAQVGTKLANIHFQMRKHLYTTVLIPQSHPPSKSRNVSLRIHKMMSAIPFYQYFSCLTLDFENCSFMKYAPLSTLALSNTEYAKIYNLLNEADCFTLNI